MKEFIIKQMHEHKNYVETFEEAPSNSNEYYHPRTHKRIGWNEMYSMIEDDMEKRANKIIKRMQAVTPK